MINDEFFSLLENRELGFLNDPIFYEIIRNTWIKTAYPQMLTHPYTAEFLYLLAKSKNIKKNIGNWHLHCFYFYIIC